MSNAELEDRVRLALVADATCWPQCLGGSSGGLLANDTRVIYA